MQGQLASAALPSPRGRARQHQQAPARLLLRVPPRAACRRVAACRPAVAALHAATPPPPRPPRVQLAWSDAAQKPLTQQHAQLVCTVAAAPPRPAPPPPSLSSTIVVSLPAWLALALTLFMATFAGLCLMVVRALLPVLREVEVSARSVKAACSGVVDACDEVEKLAVLMANDIKSVEEGISKPLQTLTRVASTLPTQALQEIMEDPDTKLLQQVAGSAVSSVRKSTEKNVRERLRKWVASLEAIRSRLQPDALLPPAPARPRPAGSGPEQRAVEAWVDAASAVAAAETAAAKLENAIDTCQTAGLCDDMSLLAAAAEDAVERDAEGQQPYNPS